MEKLPAHRILEFHPDTFQHVRGELNLEKPGEMDAAIDLLDDWVKKQVHFTKNDFPRDYLERTIALDKGSVERAKKQMDRLCTMKTSIPHYFDKTDARHKDYDLLHEHFVDALLPKMTKEYYRIYAAKAFKSGFTTSMFTYAYQFGTMFLEHIRSNDYCSGFVGIIDYRDINVMELVACINVTEMHQFLMLITEGYQLRVKGIHLLTASKSVELLVGILKQVLSKKIADRVHVHTTVETLYEYLPKDVLPEELGGDLKSLKKLNKDWVDEFSIEENFEFFKQMGHARVNEKLRSGDSNANNDVLGISGSFRSLTVD